MEARIVSPTDGYWRIQDDKGDISKEEQAKLQAFLDKIQMPYEIDAYGIGIHGSVLWEEIDEHLSLFYDGVAEVYPF